VVDAAMVDGAASLASIFYGLQRQRRVVRRPRGANLLDGGAPFYDTYETADGTLGQPGALEPKFFAEFAQRVGLDERFVRRQYDRQEWPALREAIATLFKSRTRDAWCELLEGSDACFAPVLDFTEAPQHRHARLRAGFVTLDGVTQPAPAPRFDRSRAETPRVAPRVGQHTREVLAQAGLDAGAIDALLAAGRAVAERRPAPAPAAPCLDRTELPSGPD
jgi:alpha-methylacyl-CoA racemase